MISQKKKKHKKHASFTTWSNTCKDIIKSKSFTVSITKINVTDDFFLLPSNDSHKIIMKLIILSHCCNIIMHICRNIAKLDWSNFNISGDGWTQQISMNTIAPTVGSLLDELEG